jgi:hypothetical protein
LRDTQGADTKKQQFYFQAECQVDFGRIFARRGAQKPGFPLQVLATADAVAVGFPLQSLAQPSGKRRICECKFVASPLRVLLPDALITKPESPASYSA